MDDGNSRDIQRDLADLRIDRAGELLDTARNELERGDYKSANNRAFYAMEKAARALLALKNISASTHSGVLKQFNRYYIHEGDGAFSHQDYQYFQEAEAVRQSSDYDDFYVVNKAACVRQVEHAEAFVEKVRSYMETGTVTQSQSISG